MSTISSGQWALVFGLQQVVSASTVGPRAFGCDETLEVVLDGIAAGAAPEAQVVKNLCANRAGKDRHRRRLARRLAVDAAAVCLVDAIHTKRMVAFIKTVLGEKEFATLLEVGDGAYGEVASARGVPVGTLKARVARAKARVRDAYVARFRVPIADG